MSGALAALRVPDPPDDDQDEDQDAKQQSSARNALMPFRPRNPQGDGQPQLVPQESPSDKPLLKHEIAQRFAKWMLVKNIAADLDDAERQKVADQAKREFTIDDETRSEWKTKYRDWLDFALQVVKPKSYPWAGACCSLDTDILTATGWRPIGDVKVGEMVLSRGPDRKADYYPVTETFRHHALSLVHFRGKSIDLLVTPNHRMLVESKFGKRKKQHFIEAERFLTEKLAMRYIPLTSEWDGEQPTSIHGIDAVAYVRLLGWYLAEGNTTHRSAHGDITGSFFIGQSKSANPEKYRTLRKDIEACGFGCRAYDNGFTIHTRTMPVAARDEWRSLGTQDVRCVPQHIMALSAPLLRELLATMVLGDGHRRQRVGKTSEAASYYTISRIMAGQVQEICQKLGLRGTISERAATLGGVVNGRQIVGASVGYAVEINRKQRIQVAKMERSLVREPQEVACVAVEPFHTIYVRRNGKAVWCGNSNVIFPMITVAALQFNARAYPAIVQGRNVVKGTVVGDDRGVAAMQPAQAPPGPPLGQPGGPAPGGPGRTPEAAGVPPGGGGAAAPPGPGSVPPQLSPAGPGGQPPSQPMVGPDGKPVWIVPPGAKQTRADKIGRHMSWQLLTEMPEWEEQTDRLLIVVSIVGTMFRKTYFDPASLRNVSETVDALRLCVNYRAKSFEVAPRVTEEIDVYPWDIQSNIRAGLWLDEDYGMNQDTSQDEQAPVTFCEQHRRYDLDGDGYDEPIIVTFARDSGKLARIVVGFDSEGIEATHDGEVQKIEPTRFYTKYGFIPNPDGGVYDVGFGHLLYPLNAAVNTTINQMFDAGHLQIAGGGFIGGGMSINTGAVRFTTGEYKVIQTQGKSLRDNIVPMQWPGPNPVLMQLMQYLIESAKDIGSIKDVLTGDIPGANVPGILGLAVIQQGLKVFNSIFKRIHRSLRKDYEKLFRLNRLYLPDTTGFRIGSEYFSVTRADYERGGGAEPVSDPDMVTDTQQMAQANFLLQFAQDPFFDGREIRLRVMQAAAIQQVDKLIAAQAPPNAAIAAQLAQLDLEKQQVDIQHRLTDLRAQELAIRAAHQEANLDIKRGKDKATEIRDLTQSILNLANAVKADHEVNQDWYGLQLTNLRHQIDLLNIAAESEPPENSPAAAAGLGRAAQGITAGLTGGGVPGMAPPSGLPGGAALPGGLPGQPPPGGA